MRSAVCHEHVYVQVARRLAAHLGVDLGVVVVGCRRESSSTVMFDVSHCAAYASEMFERTADLFLRQYADEVRLPTPAELDVSRAQFRARFGLEGCVGAIDGTHIRHRYAY